MADRMQRSYQSRIRRLGIRIPVWGYGDEERLARIVYGTWHALPLSDRRVLRAHWAAINARYCEADASNKRPLLTIELCETWARRNLYTVGEVVSGTNVIRLLAAAVHLMPDQIVTISFAHELMHVLREARGETEQNPDWEEELTRLDVETVWGYSEDHLTDWLEENGDEIERLVGELMSNLRAHIPDGF